MFQRCRYQCPWSLNIQTPFSLWSEVKWSRLVVSDSVTPWTVAHQAPPSMGFSRREYWSGCHCLLHLSLYFKHFVVVQSLCQVWLFATPGLQHFRFPWPLLSPGVSALISIESMMPSNHLILCCPLLLLSIFSNIRVSSNESALRIRRPKY